jgi:hypothetical protein
MDGTEVIDRGLHEPALELISRSAIARRLARVGRWIESAASGSRSVNAIAAAAARWAGLSRTQRHRALGLMLMIAATVHCGLTLLNRLPAGWMWLIVPAIAFVQGAVLIAASSSTAPDPS